MTGQSLSHRQKAYRGRCAAKRLFAEADRMQRRVDKLTAIKRKTRGQKDELAVLRLLIPTRRLLGEQTLRSAEARSGIADRMVERRKLYDEWRGLVGQPLYEGVFKCDKAIDRATFDAMWGYRETNEHMFFLVEGNDFDTIVVASPNQSDIFNIRMMIDGASAPTIRRKRRAKA